MKTHLFLTLVMLLAPSFSFGAPTLSSGPIKIQQWPSQPAPSSTSTVLWDQPVSGTDVAYASQDFESDLDDYDIAIADDFSNQKPWKIDVIYLPGLLWNGATSLTQAISLNVEIYADNAGVPAGKPWIGGPPLWSVSLAPNDAQVSISEGPVSNTTITLSEPLTLKPGKYWLVHYVRMDFTAFGQFGRFMSDTANGYIAKWINPRGAFGFGTEWGNWGGYNTFGKQDVAFRLEGSVIPPDHLLSYAVTKAPKTPSLKPVPVKLQDRFETSSYIAKKQTNLLNPVEKTFNGKVTPILSPDTHFLGSSLSLAPKSCTEASPENAFGACVTDADCGGEAKAKVFCKKTPKHQAQTFIKIDNQFGTVYVSTKKADSLLLPSATSLEGPIPALDNLDVNHYKCYTVKENKGFCENDTSIKCKSDAQCESVGGICNQGLAKNLNPVLVDEFGQKKGFELKQVDRLCTPVAKTHNGTVSEILDTENSYLCYVATPLKKACTEDSPNPYQLCKTETDCGGQVKATRFCQTQAPFEKKTGVYVSNQFGDNQLINVTKTGRLCVPSQESQSAP